MIIHDLIQGSAEWDQFRLEHYGASEAAPMLGISPYVKRTELLHMKHTGTAKEFSEWMQKNILDRGHALEALARPIIEEIIGDDLYPVTCSDGIYSASCDGLNMMETIAFEHKQWNKILAASVREGILPNEHIPQCQQVLMVTGAEKLIFAVSDGTRENLVYMEVLPDPAWHERLRAGWDQFGKDLATYVPVVHAEKPQAAAIRQLPALAIQIRGEVVTSNLPAFTKSAHTFLASINMDLKTDEDFANAEETVKFCERAEKELEHTKAAVIAQTASIEDVMGTIDYVKDQLRGKRITLDRLIKTQKDVIRNGYVSKARMDFSVHVTNLETEIFPIRLVYPQPDFQGAIKNKRTLKSLDDAISSALATAKITVDGIAQGVRRRLAWAKEHAADYTFLLSDMQHLVYKADDDFQLVIENRVEQHKQQEAKKLEDQRQRIQAEADRLARERAQAGMVAPPSPAAPAPVAAPVAAPAAMSRPIAARTVKPMDNNGALLALALHDLGHIRHKYGNVRELAGVLREIDLFIAMEEQRKTVKA